MINGFFGVSLENLATIFTVMYTFINMFRVLYHIHVTRMVELDNVIKDAVQYTYDTYVKDRKFNGVWNNATKIQATNLAFEYTINKTNTCCLVKKHRMMRLIKDEVSVRKARMIGFSVRNRIELV